ncbi:MAG: hypothetical protein ACK5YB_14850 [Burkholderiales bacterium]
MNIRGFFRAGLVVAIAAIAPVGVAMAQERGGQCASEGGSCFMPSGGQGFNTLTFAYGKKATIRKVEGVSQVPCNTLFGDPAPGQGPKQCFAQQLNLNLSEKLQYQQCVSEGQWCRSFGGGSNQAPGDFREARFGDPRTGRWAYWFAASDFQCNHANAGFDPAPGDAKVCQLSEKLYQFGANTGKLDDWTYCAGEGAKCTGLNGRYLVAFGLGNSWVVREVETDSFGCDLGSFNSDPASGKSKQCYKKPYPLERKVLSLDGAWHLLNSCGGAPCTFTAEYTTGQSNTDKTVNTESWTKQVTNTFNTKLEIAGPVAKSVTEFQNKTVDTSSVLNETVKSVTSTQSESKSVTCTGYALYQWFTTVQQTCVVDNLCPAVVGRTPYLYCQTQNTVPSPLWTAKKQ